MSDSSARIAALNDAFRTTLTGGRVVMTPALATLGPDGVGDLLLKVRQFMDFNSNNDPHGEHDFGSIQHKGDTYFWKIDYYDQTVTYGSDDPADPGRTVRVLTVMHTSEY